MKLKYPDQKELDRKAVRSRAADQAIIALRILYAAPVIFLTLPLIVCDKAANKTKYGRKSWSIHFRIKRLAVDYLVWAINPGFRPLLNQSTYLDRRKLKNGGGKEYTTKLVEIPADTALEWVLGDAVHETCKNERCPAFWQFHTSSHSATFPESLIAQETTATTTTTSTASTASQDNRSPKSQHNGKVILYFVGGGYVQGHPALLKLAYITTKCSGTPVFSVNYRKAVLEQDSFPAALLDAISGYHYLITHYHYHPSNIILMGDSAGGGLCITLILHLLRFNLPIPGKTILISPWVDLTSTFLEGGKTVTELSRRDYLNQEMLGAGAYQYTRQRPDLRGTLLSPVLNTLPSPSPSSPSPSSSSAAPPPSLLTARSHGVDSDDIQATTARTRATGSITVPVPVPVPVPAPVPASASVPASVSASVSVSVSADKDRYRQDSGYTFTGFPETFLAYGDAEMFSLGNAQFATLLRTHDVHVDVFVGADQVHVFPLYIVDHTSEASYYTHVSNFIHRVSKEH